MALQTSEKNVTHPACLQRKEKYVWHPSFLKSSASAWQSYVAGQPRGPWRERLLLATTQRNADQPAWVGLHLGEDTRQKSPFPRQTVELSESLSAAPR